MASVLKKHDLINDQCACFIAQRIGHSLTTYYMMDREHKVQSSCVKWFRLQYPEYAWLLFAIPNGGARSVTTGRRMKEEGVVAGVADMFLAMPCGQRHGLFIEMKTDKGVQSKPQKEFQESVMSAGYDYVIARSTEDFIHCVNGWIGIR